MYPDLYYLFREVLGLEWPFLHHITTFGFSIALSFIVGLYFLKKYLLEKEAAGYFITKKLAWLIQLNRQKYYPVKVLPPGRC
ncbi:hypothetical protein [Niabella ginsengisoli]|uniref:Uncharacterized protein n=1 Tax=Niabella ginsengisoli TaxID=522298 RepID=A0ABS9SDN9_9BACT|nr:hypothetical protein [Niabella ginsengisoli]MCH5596474.1 hypothetical protein [Niabella ginsengisoli]